MITLLTDFGTADGYVGEVKGVLASRAAGVPIVDIAHDVTPQDVDAARLALARYWRRFPEGTVHLVVVDPGVGSARAAMAVASAGRLLVGPDNGVLSPALLLPGARAVRLPVPDAAAPTFHGRDVFAPAAALLARGADLESLGDPHVEPVLRRTPEPRRLDDGALEGEIITVDRFGNGVTNLMAPRGGSCSVGGRVLGEVRRTYGDAPPGVAIALTGSSGLLEIAIRDGSAAAVLGLRRGDRVVLRPPRA
ncbi:MAG TPA: SAM-dependent chlorinase/fluorinase [Gemmatimonadaceae bacterium]|nr:SAM-dependent chlorinase/fluorinase [Gemmatimonadaceae bacterium]